MKGASCLDGGSLTRRARRIIKTSSYHHLLWNGMTGGGFVGCRAWVHRGDLEGERGQAVGRVGGKDRRYPAGARAPCDVSAGVSVGRPQDIFLAELRDGTLGLRDLNTP